MRQPTSSRYPMPVTTNPFTRGVPAPIRKLLAIMVGLRSRWPGTIGGAVPYGARSDFLSLDQTDGTSGLGAGGYEGVRLVGSRVSVVTLRRPIAYRSRESPIRPETLVDQGTYNQLPIWHSMKGMYGTSPFVPELNRPTTVRCRCRGSDCECEGPSGRVSDSGTDRPGDYDIGIPAYGGISDAGPWNGLY